MYIGRAGHGQDGYFGNPFPLEDDTPEGRAECLAKFRTYFYERVASDPVYRQRVQDLRGKVLGCFCTPNPCHGDVILEYLSKR